MRQLEAAGQTGTTKVGLHVRLLIFALASFSVAGTCLAAGRVFYDGFESGNTNLWRQDSTRNRCQVVTSAADGIAGPFAKSRMLRCNDNGTVPFNDPAEYETLQLGTGAINYSQELFIRTRVRVDSNLEKTPGSAKKILRVFNFTGVTSEYNDIYEAIYNGDGLRNTGVAGGGQFATYFGGTGSDQTSNPSSWHKVEYYINTSGTIKVWHDGALVQNFTGLRTNGAKWLPFYLTSNWSDPHDATNYVYFDEFEVFTDTGSGASGLMSNATVSGSGGAPPPLGAPPNLRIF